MKIKITLTVIILLMIGLLIYVIMMPSNLNNQEQMKTLDEVALTGELKQEEIIEEENDKLVTKEYTASDGKTYEIVAVLYIPTLEIEYPVFSSTSTELLKVSLNKYWGPNPNKVGNFCIIGHNYNDDRFFGKLHNIEIGHFIHLTDMTGKTLQYKVYDTYTVDPSDTSCTSQLTDGNKEITLITCTKDFKQRFIVKARETY